MMKMKKIIFYIALTSCFTTIKSYAQVKDYREEWNLKEPHSFNFDVAALFTSRFKIGYEYLLTDNWGLYVDFSKGKKFDINLKNEFYLGFNYYLKTKFLHRFHFGLFYDRPTLNYFDMEKSINIYGASIGHKWFIAESVFIDSIFLLGSSGVEFYIYHSPKEIAYFGGPILWGIEEKLGISF